MWSKKYSLKWQKMEKLKYLKVVLKYSSWVNVLTVCEINKHNIKTLSVNIDFFRRETWLKCFLFLFCPPHLHKEAICHKQMLYKSIYCLLYCLVSVGYMKTVSAVSLCMNYIVFYFYHSLFGMDGKYDSSTVIYWKQLTSGPLCASVQNSLLTC